MLAHAHTIAFTMTMSIASNFVTVVRGQGACRCKPMPDGRPSPLDVLLAWGWEGVKSYFGI